MVVTFIEMRNTGSGRGLNRQENRDEPSLESAEFEVLVMKRSLIFLFEAFAFSLQFERTKPVASG